MILTLTLIFLNFACNWIGFYADQSTESVSIKKDVLPGAYQTDRYLPLLKGKSIGLVVNHTSLVGDTHLVDTLISSHVDVKVVFAPEHGFKGTAYNGEEVRDGLYLGYLPIKSLYGKNKKPNPDDLKDVDIIVFDIQDVGARFYTYISTLHFVMEAAAEEGIEVIILDRPNPNNHYVDGPVLEESLTSFVGMHPVPVVYGMTIGEYGLMINGEQWLANGVQCKLSVIKIANQYTHLTRYELPTSPSPNLPNQRSILLYPSLCFFEGTVVSVGRGTDMQFQIFGHPKMKGDFTFRPVSMSSSKYPKQENLLCRGVNLQVLEEDDLYHQEELNLEYLIHAYHQMSDTDSSFFLETNFFDKLVGNTTLKKQIIDGWTEEQIRNSWSDDLEEFKKQREKYLLYP